MNSAYPWFKGAVEAAMADGQMVPAKRGRSAGAIVVLDAHHLQSQVGRS